MITAFLIIWLGLTVVVGASARKRNRSFLGWWLLAAFAWVPMFIPALLVGWYLLAISPVFVWMLLVALPEKGGGHIHVAPSP